MFFSLLAEAILNSTGIWVSEGDDKVTSNEISFMSKGQVSLVLFQSWVNAIASWMKARLFSFDKNKMSAPFKIALCALRRVSRSPDAASNSSLRFTSSIWAMLNTSFACCNSIRGFKIFFFAEFNFNMAFCLVTRQNAFLFWHSKSFIRDAQFTSRQHGVAIVSLMTFTSHEVSHWNGMLMYL